MNYPPPELVIPVDIWNVVGEYSVLRKQWRIAVLIQRTVKAEVKESANLIWE